MDYFQKQFDKANLPVHITDKPIGAFVRNQMGEKIFQMTIDQGGRERFRIFKGNGNDIKVLDIDPKKQQLVLYVKEPKRTFTTMQWRKGKGSVPVTRTTPEGVRRYLMGKDERHLFVSELPQDKRITTVHDAFRLLKPAQVKDRKKRKGSKIKRQGEWFFIKATTGELEEIKKNLTLVRKKIGIASRGKPHVADELLRTSLGVFVKGNIRHSDHKTIHFFEWQRVLRNTERIDVRDQFFGWID